MKKILFALLVLCVSAFAQTTPPVHTFSLNLSPISLPGGHQTVAGTEAGAALTVTPNFDVATQNIIATASNFQYFAGRFNYRLSKLSTKLNNLSPTINGLRLQFGITGSAGVSRITLPSAVQHFGYTGGGFVNYSLDQGGHYSLGAEVQYARFPGLQNNTFTVSLDPAIHF